MSTSLLSELLVQEIFLLVRSDTLAVVCVVFGSRGRCSPAASLTALHVTLAWITLLADYLDRILPSCLNSALNTRTQLQTLNHCWKMWVLGLPNGSASITSECFVPPGLHRACFSSEHPHQYTELSSVSLRLSRGDITEPALPIYQRNHRIKKLWEGHDLISFLLVCVGFTHFKYYSCAWGEKGVWEKYGNIQQQLKFWVSRASRRSWALCWEPVCRQHPCKDVTTCSGSVNIFTAFPQCLEWIIFKYWQDECFSSMGKSDWLGLLFVKDFLQFW